MLEGKKFLITGIANKNIPPGLLSNEEIKFSFDIKFKIGTKSQQ